MKTDDAHARRRVPVLARLAAAAVGAALLLTAGLTGAGQPAALASTGSGTFAVSPGGDATHGGFFDVSSTAIERQGTLTGHGTASYYGAAGPGVVRTSLSGSFSNPAGLTLLYNPRVIAQAATTLTVSGPAEPGSITTSLNIHVDGVLRHVCGPTVLSCEASVGVQVNVNGGSFFTDVSTAQGVARNQLGLTVTPTADGLRVTGDVATPPVAVAVNQPFPVFLRLVVVEADQGDGRPADFSWNHDFSDLLSGNGLSFAPSGPVLNVPAGYEVNGAGVVNNRWEDPFTPATIVQGDLVVTDCDDPFLAQVTEITGNLIIEDLECDAALALPNLVRVGGDVQIAGTTVNVDADDAGATVVIDLGDLTAVDGDLTVETTEVNVNGDNEGAVVIDLGDLTAVDGDLTVETTEVNVNGDNEGAVVIDLGELESVGDGVTVTENGAASVVFGDLTSVGCDLTLETTGPSLDLGTLQSVGCDMILTATGADTVAATTADGTTDVTVLGGTAQMHVVLPDGAFDKPVPFTIDREPDRPSEDGTTAGGAPARVDPVGGYRFSFAVPTLGQDAELALTIDLSELDAATRQAVLEGVADGSATIVVKGDEDGATYQAFARCGEGETPEADGCVAVVLLGADGSPLAEGGEPAFVHFKGVVGHFSTYAVALVTPVDSTPPTVTCKQPAPVFVLGENPAEVTAAVTDEGSGPEAATVSASANTTSVGAKTVALTGRDLAGNETTVACGYRVEYRFEGLFDPVDNRQALNAVRAGRVVPLKWRLTDAEGAPVTDLAAAEITAVTLACDLGTTPDRRVEEIAGSGLQNMGDGYYQLNWRVPAAYAGSCKTLRLDLGEGAFRTALFRLR